MINLLTGNRASTVALKQTAFGEDKNIFKNWKNAVEKLRLKVSAYAVRNREDATEEERQIVIDEFYTAYREVLSFLWEKIDGQKVKPQATDLNSLLAIVGSMRKERDSVDGKTFIPVSATTFRKSVEDFISDRVNSMSCKTAEQIEDERKAKNEAEKEAEKAKGNKVA